MPYKTRPYIKRSGGFVPNPMVEITIEPNKISVKRALIDTPDVQSWNGTASARVIKSKDESWVTKAAKSLASIGDVEVSADGIRELYKNIANTAAFISAVEGTHPAIREDIEAPIREAAELAALQTRPFFVDIPAPPRELYAQIAKTTQGAQGLTWLVGEGDRVKAGTTVAKYESKSLKLGKERFEPKIIMPYDGQITSIYAREYGSWTRTPEEIKKGLNTSTAMDQYRKEDLLFSFQLATNRDTYIRLSEPQNYAEEYTVGHILINGSNDKTYDELKEYFRVSKQLELGRDALDAGSSFQTEHPLNPYEMLRSAFAQVSYGQTRETAKPVDLKRLAQENWEQNNLG